MSIKAHEIIEKGFWKRTHFSNSSFLILGTSEKEMCTMYKFSQFSAPFFTFLSLFPCKSYSLPSSSLLGVLSFSSLRILDFSSFLHVCLCAMAFLSPQCISQSSSLPTPAQLHQMEEEVISKQEELRKAALTAETLEASKCKRTVQCSGLIEEENYVQI